MNTALVHQSKSIHQDQYSDASWLRYFDPRLGVNRFDPARGLSPQGLRDIIGDRTARALGETYRLAAHDTRRTAAAIAYDAGMPLTDIQALLRHKDAAVTLRYIGTKPDFGGRTLSNYVTFG